MKRALRLTHFDKNKKVKVLELGFDDAAINDKGYSEEGSLLISIQSENSKAFFQLSTAEASLLKDRLDFVIALLSKQYIDTEERAAKNRSKQNKEKMDEIDEEIEGEEE
ncbi:hypothetical protein [Saccharolobus shibatae]|uniref:Uncharacterized protein n=1 Tax=Saccharolobus shibatae TaxID=2286 RepID=A0A8F5GUY4_9CREN|nr:hypothetical protein [Saccharolobus shibatae]QXJ30316.1 hypothetical protein J5U21_p0058 [Saccharolobus shibatae]QXJ30418.1 hypothetical protein J5U21_00058 [Saccharolobus shibatae]